MKEELRRKHASAAGSVIVEETKNELMKRGQNQARASSSESSPFQILFL